MSDEEDHNPKDESTWKFNRTKKSPDYEKACRDGYRRAALAEIHHAMCEHALSDDYMDPAKKDFIHECLAITDWDLDKPGNTIGLPKKWAYVNAVDSEATVRDRTRSFTAPELAARNVSGRWDWDNLPCHQVDHNPNYTKWTCDYVKEEIWDKLESTKKNGPCKKAKPKNIKAQFQTGSKKFKDFLKDRGTKHGGTAHCLAFAVSEISANTKHKKEQVAEWGWVQAQKKKGWSCSKTNWWVPFSMDKDPPRERQPPTIGNRGVMRTGLLDLVT
jgi:hypothetical protein